MSEIIVEDDPEPLPKFKNGLHYYDVRDFVQEIVRPDSRHTEQYREWYHIQLAQESSEIVLEHSTFSILERVAATKSSSLLRRLGRFARIVSVE